MHMHVCLELFAFCMTSFLDASQLWKECSVINDGHFCNVFFFLFPGFEAKQHTTYYDGLQKQSLCKKHYYG